MSDALQQFLEGLPDNELHRVNEIVRKILADRSALTSQVVVIRLDMDGPGLWAKKVTGFCSAIPSAFGILGPFLNLPGAALKEGTYIVFGGALDDHVANRTTITRQGSWSLYGLARVKKGAKLRLGSGLHKFEGDGLEIVCHSNTQIDPKTTIERAPGLSNSLGRPLFPIFAELSKHFEDTLANRVDRPPLPAARRGGRRR
jgi:hypothetical protein